MAAATGTIGVRYIGRKNLEVDQWAGTGTVWPFPSAIAAMPEDKGRKLVAMLPAEFELADEPQEIQAKQPRQPKKAK